jgi:hypothetical protein
VEVMTAMSCLDREGAGLVGERLTRPDELCAGCLRDGLGVVAGDHAGADDGETKRGGRHQ